MKLSDLLQKLETQASNLETLSHDIDMCISSAQEIDRVVTTSIKEIQETVQSVKDAQDRIKETL